MSIKVLSHRLLLAIVVTIGIVPLVYFATVEIGIASATTTAKERPVEDADGSIGRYVENIAFGINEKLTFDINYGFINAGSATLEVAQLIEYEGRPCYQIQSRARSNSFFSSFYEVDDRIESIVDAIGLFSWRFEKSLSEGNYKSNRMFTIDQRNHLVYYQDDTVEVNEYVQDALSMLYYLRTQNLKVGDEIEIDNYTDGKCYPVKVIVRERERVNVQAGSFDCLVVEPMLQTVGVFKNEGQLKVWLTDDRLKLPVLMKSKVLVGSISAELTDYTLGEIEAF
jgi:hypothetical protein